MFLFSNCDKETIETPNQDVNGLANHDIMIFLYDEGVVWEYIFLGNGYRIGLNELESESDFVPFDNSSLDSAIIIFDNIRGITFHKNDESEYNLLQASSYTRFGNIFDYTFTEEVYNLSDTVDCLCFIK